MDIGDASAAGNTSEHCAAHTAPRAGMVYLRRPVGQITRLPSTHAVRTEKTLPGAEAGTRATTNATSTPGIKGDSGRQTIESANSAKPLLGGPTSPESRQAVTREVARLLWSWLEAYDGRRPISALRRGPFSPTVLEELRSLIRDTIEERHDIPSRLLRVHLPPSHHHRLAFTASAAVDGRVRAIAGHLARYNSRWRVESIVLLRSS